MRTSRTLLALTLCLAGTSALAQDDPQAGPHAAAQSAADALRQAAGSDGAFIAAGLIVRPKAKDLAQMMQFATDEILVLSLSGSQIRRAFEKSVSIYPHPNSSFLQVSGFEITFSRSASPDKRVTSITVSGAPLQDGRTYTVAMPASLGRAGGFGYFTIWDQSTPTRTLTGATVESVLRGKSPSPSSPRYTVLP
jgi:hypothetical protein